jgi:hypothetical protein
MKRSVALIAMVSLGVGLAVGIAVAQSQGSASSADVPSGFASRMNAMGITYSDASPVDVEVRSAVLHAVSHGSSPIVGQSQPIVLRVTFTDNEYRDHGRRIYVNRPAVMVIYPNTPVALSGPRGTQGGSIKSTFVDFVDPNSFRYLRAVSFATTTHVTRPTV